MSEQVRDDEADFRQAFGELFPLAFRVAWRIVGNVTAAEDCAAEALARAFQRWPKVRGLTYRDAWVMRVAANIAIDTVRKKTPLIDPGFGADPADAATTRLALAAALRALPRRQRDAVVLRYLHGYREDEVARALDVSPGTVKTHLKRGTETLRRKLGDAFEKASIDA